MLTTNLLTSQGKKTIRLEEIRRITQRSIAVVCLVFLGGATLLLPSYLPLFLHSRTLEKTLAVSEDTVSHFATKDINMRARNLKNNIATLKKNFEEPRNVSDILTETFKKSDGISLLSLTVKKGSQFVLSGRAAHRQDLLLFEQLLRASGKIQELSLPLSQIVQETNIAWRMEGNLKPMYGL